MNGSLPVADNRAVRHEARRLLRADPRAVTVIVLLNCAAAALGLAAPWLVGEIVNRVAAGAEVSTVDLLAVAIVAFAVAQLLVTRFARYAAFRFGERSLASLRERFVDDTLALPVSVVERAGVGDLITRGSSDVAQVGGTLRDAVPDLFVSVVQAVFILGAVFALHPLLGLCALAGIPLMWCVTRWYLNRSRTAYLAEGEANSALADAMAATAEGARSVEVFGLRQQRIDAAERAISASYAARMRTLSLRTVFIPGTVFAHSIPVAVTLVGGGAAHRAGLLSLGAVIAAGLYLWQLVDPLDHVLFWLEQLQSSGASLARIKGVAEAAADDEPARAVPVDDRIEVKALRYAYRGTADVLHDLDLTVHPGERLAIVGPSGAGKSTLGRLLAGMDAPRTGSVTLGGVDVHRLAPDRALLVTQEHHVFVGTLRDNLAMAAPAASDDRLAWALETVGWTHPLPDGLDTELGDPTRGDPSLDPAQAQQIALARVLLADPRTVILDETTAMLDPNAARRVERSLAAVLEGRTVIAIAHRLHTAYDADRVAVLEHGRLTELGSHEDLLAAQGTYAALWRSWHS
ncbi:ABC transporter ATP-binding protein [Amycolatopsis halotolerans]|uniref:ABC transporter ATP-binding protein n=1 Tax=Amycolatopsis halotolerans TaxID=330083 RepID=A0ABV7QBD9_9PSEU